MKRIRKGDKVIVTAGKSKGHIGDVLCVKDSKLKIEGAALVKKHVKPNPNLNETGGVRQIESFIDVSNVALLNPATKKADKVGFRFDEVNGELVKVRYFKSNQEVVDRGQG